jgi:hypothetical protein
MVEAPSLDLPILLELPEAGRASGADGVLAD